MLHKQTAACLSKAPNSCLLEAGDKITCFAIKMIGTECLLQSLSEVTLGPGKVASKVRSANQNAVEHHYYSFAFKVRFISGTGLLEVIKRYSIGGR